MTFCTNSFRIVKRKNDLDFYNNRPQKLGSINIKFFTEAFNRVMSSWDEAVAKKTQEYQIFGRFFSSGAGLHYISTYKDDVSYNVLKRGRLVLVVKQDFKTQLHNFIQELEENA